MTQADVKQLIADNPKLLAEATLVETHISWVILTEKYAYKLKKPVIFSFLDFSTLDKRLFFCRRELLLNRRFTDNIYLEVLPVYQKEDQCLTFETESAEIVDYAVKMRRLDSTRQMDILLKKNLVTPEHIVQLARQLAAFHMSTDVVSAHPDIKAMQEDFADILKIAPFIEEHWGSEAALVLHTGVAYSEKALAAYQHRIYERHLEGFTIDGHGDLHAKNIFLLEEPVIFDCIEFNDHFRQLDVLNELAFLCMDLDFHHQPGFSNYLLEEYTRRYVCINNSVDEKIFHYYKLYRANVRLKINTLSAQQIADPEAFKKQLTIVSEYLELFKQYLDNPDR